MSTTRESLSRAVAYLKAEFGDEAVGLATIGGAVFTLIAAVIVMKLLGAVLREFSHTRQLRSQVSTSGDGVAASKHGKGNKRGKKGGSDDNVDDLVMSGAASKSKGSHHHHHAPTIDTSFDFSRPRNSAIPVGQLKGFRQEVLALVGSASNVLVSSRDRVCRLYTNSCDFVNVPLTMRTVGNAGFSDDGTYMALYFTEKNNVSVYRTSDLKREMCTFESGLPQDIRLMHISPSGRVVITVSQPGCVETHVTETGERAENFAFKMGTCHAYAARGKFLAVAGSLADDIRFFEIFEKGGEYMFLKPKVTYFVMARCKQLAFTSDMSILAVGDTGKMCMWTIDCLYDRGAHMIHVGNDHVDTDFAKHISLMNVSPDGRYLVLGAGPHLALYEINAKKGTFRHIRDYHDAHTHTVVSSIVFARPGSDEGHGGDDDGTGWVIMTTGLDDKAVRMWSI